MIKFYQPQSSKKLTNKPFVVFVNHVYENGNMFSYNRFGNPSTHKKNVWSGDNTGNIKGLIADLCPLDLSKWSEEE